MEEVECEKRWCRIQRNNSEEEETTSYHKHIRGYKGQAGEFWPHEPIV